MRPFRTGQTCVAWLAGVKKVQRCIKSGTKSICTFIHTRSDKSMKTKVFALAAAATLIASPAFAQKGPGNFMEKFDGSASVATLSDAPSAPSGGPTAILPIDGIDSWDARGDSDNYLLLVDVGANNVVTAIGYDAALTTAPNGSWCSEARFVFTDSAETSGVAISPGFETGAPCDADNLSSGGPIDLVGLGFQPIIGADGLLRIEAYESFDDVADEIDATWSNASAPVVANGFYMICEDQAACDAAFGGGEPDDEARFAVNKNFDDDNEGSVEVTLSCNTGIPLEQTTTIEEGDGVNFVVGDFNQGELNCEITETPVDGYTTQYFTDAPVTVEGVATSCSYEDLEGGQYVCFIENNLEAVTVTVTKEWVDDNPGFNPFNIADAEWSCDDVAFGADEGDLSFFAEGSLTDSDSFSVFPDWDTGTSCDIDEVDLPDGGVEVDDSNCQNILLFPGGGASCTIVNTRLYEGIPTLSQYGLAIMALLMLGVGFVGFRRFV